MSAQPPRFPTMLRKMWSGSEVQAWIDANWISPEAVTTAGMETPTNVFLFKKLCKHHQIDLGVDDIPTALRKIRERP